MNSSLVLISIGPVQSFIASARKTEDLWAGSYLLSYLVEQAIEELHYLVNHYSGTLEVIFPDEDQPVAMSQVAPYPNRILGKVNMAKEHVPTLCQELVEFIYEEFEEICLFGLKDTFQASNCKIEFMEQLVIKQVHELLEVTWAIEPITSNYELARTNIESRLAAVKNHRSFTAGKQDGLVCTVCGERDALHETPFRDTDKVGYMRYELSNTWQKRSDKYSRREEKEETDTGEEIFTGRIRDNEMLCGVCLGKRTAREYFKSRTNKRICAFPSVLEIAGDYRYYAIISMDGDDMGQWLAGLKGKMAVKPGTIEYNRLISSKLGSFAGQEVPKIIEEAKGELVFAGGDDVLAFVPINKVLEVINQLRNAFCHPELGLHPEATASLGAAIVHKRYPLGAALEHARSGESRAKNYVHPITKKSKDAVGITILTRSGEGRQFVAPWMIEGEFDLEGEGNIIALMEKLVLHLEKDLSPNFIQSFKASFLPMLNSSLYKQQKIAILKEQESNTQLLTTELTRLMTRSLLKPISISLETVKNLATKIIQVHNTTNNGYEFIDWLESVQLFAKAFKRKEGDE